MTDNVNRIAEIDAEIAKLEKERKELVDSKKKQVISSIKDLVKTYGLSIDELSLPSFSSASPKKTVEPKYQLNDKTWSGRGIKPTFIVEHEKSGGKLEDLLIKK